MISLSLGLSTAGSKAVGQFGEVEIALQRPGHAVADQTRQERGQGYPEGLACHQPDEQEADQETELAIGNPSPPDDKLKQPARSRPRRFGPSHDRSTHIEFDPEEL